MENSIGSIRNVWCVGRNFGAHAKEMGSAVPEANSRPLIFLKSGACLVPNGSLIRWPTFSNEVHHEIEIAFRFGKSFEFDQLSLAIDLTARDVQKQLKQNQEPWTLAKSFRDACPVGPLVSWSKTKDAQNLSFWFSINGEVRQKGHSGDMIHSVERLRSYVLENFPVTEGDLLLTGTPAGVGPIKTGDRLEASLDLGTESGLENLLKANWTVG